MHGVTNDYVNASVYRIKLRSGDEKLEIYIWCMSSNPEFAVLLTTLLLPVSLL